jgi:hypothetical protein
MDRLTNTNDKIESISKLEGKVLVTHEFKHFDRLYYSLLASGLN